MALNRGPIPAHAGEPNRRLGIESAGGAYPRSRGGTACLGQLANGNWGLSPLTRGNLPPVAAEGSGDGPIPAHAGEPA